MTPHKFRDTIGKLGLSQVKAAHVLGFTPRTARRWAMGAAKIPAPAAKLLRLMKDGKVSETDVRTTPC
jgi:DNA-binding transcriptional regulator YiaG